MRFFSLKTKLPLSILAVLLIILSVGTGFVLHTADSIISYMRSARLEDISRSLSRSVSVQLERAGKDIVLSAGLPVVQDAVGQGAGLSVAGKASLGSLLYRIKQACGYYDDFALIDERGAVIAAAGFKDDAFQGLGKRWLQRALAQNTFFVAEPFFDSVSGMILIPVSMKIVYNGKVAVLAGTLELDKITKGLLRDIATPSVRGYVVIGKGELVSALGPTAAVQALFTEGNWFAEKIRNTVFGSMRVTMGDDEKTLGFHHVPQTDIYTVAVADDAYMRPFFTTMQRASLISVIVSALLASACICFFIFPVTRDIRFLSQFARQIADGKKEATTQVRRTDELGDLATSLKRMVDTLQDMLGKAEAATRVKGDFLARMSHEIRTPMNGIIGLTYLAMRENPDEKQRGFLRRIDSAAKNLLGLINDILDFSKMEADKMELVKERFSLSEKLRTIYDLIQVQSREKGLELVFTQEPDVPDVVEGDPLRLSQVCINICSNAVKFSEQGSVCLHVAVQEEHPDGFLLLFTVQDTGIGMSGEAVKGIFTAFNQVGGYMTRRFEGTGLGLAISKSLVEMMGGKIWVESTPGKGSVFYFTVYMGRAEPQSIAQEADAAKADEPEVDLSSTRILVAEDNMLNQEIIREMLQDMGAKVTLADNGEEAVQLWNSNDYDIVILDIQMPVMDGLSASRVIRSSPRPGSDTVPILAMTAHAMVADKERSLEAGMNEHITKPIDVVQLRETIRRWSARTARAASMDVTLYPRSQ
ncbi:response regulator [Desulfovibrio sp. OttesenSCG-928-G15]|nr:response regulator [Desulfovibrio sp. OttesenSCG-928-G15]